MKPSVLCFFIYLLLLTCIATATAQESEESSIVAWCKQVVQAVVEVFSLFRDAMQELKHWVALHVMRVGLAKPKKVATSIIIFPQGFTVLHHPRQENDIVQLLEPSKISYRRCQPALFDPRQVALTLYSDHSSMYLQHLKPKSTLQMPRFPHCALTDTNEQTCGVLIPSNVSMNGVQTTERDPLAGGFAETLAPYSGRSIMLIVILVLAWFVEMCEAKEREKIAVEAAATCIQTFIRREEDMKVIDRRRLQDLTASQRSLEMNELFQRGMKEVKVSGNGNCLYYAISYSLFGCVDYHEDLREKVADWLAANGEYQLMAGVPLSLTEGLPWDDYVASMRKDREYATCACLHAIAAIYSCYVIVVTDYKCDIIIDQCNTTQKGIILAFSGKHYNPLLYEPTKRIINIPEKIPEDMWECGTCTRWTDAEHSKCHRCGVMK